MYIIIVNTQKLCLIKTTNVDLYMLYINCTYAKVNALTFITHHILHEFF